MSTNLWPHLLTYQKQSSVEENSKEAAVILLSQAMKKDMASTIRKVAAYLRWLQFATQTFDGSTTYANLLVQHPHH